MQKEAGFGGDHLGRKCGATRIVKHHHARPILFLVLGLHLAQKLGVAHWLIIVLGAHHRILVVAQCPQLGNVSGYQHVAVGENGPAFVVAQIRRQKARERKIGGLEA